MARTLIIDDEATAARALQRLLQRSGFASVEVAYSGKEGLEKLSTFEADLVISDLRMPDMYGDRVLRQVRDVAPNALRVLMSAIMTAFMRPELALEAWDIEPELLHFYFAKPWDDEQLVVSLRGLLARKYPLSRSSF